ncbi:MAG: BamA/TamA family outer membrane protein, partial [Bacteroidota bacterium]
DRLSEFDPDGSLIADRPVGFNGGQLLGIGPALVWDTRNNVLWPTAGHFLNVELSYFTNALGMDYEYGRYLIDYRRYKSLWNEKNVIAFQAQFNGITGNNVPFYSLPQLGGDEQLRGIANENLYRDKNAVFLQAEARKDLLWRFGGVLFAGAGTVYNDWSNPVEEVRVVYGLGARFQTLKDQKLNVRVDLGFSQEGQNALYISIREAF